MQDFPRKRGYVYTTSITLRMEPELKAEFEHLKKTTNLDIGEAQREVLRDLVARLKAAAVLAS